MPPPIWSRNTVWIAGNVLTAADLNAEFNSGLNTFNSAFDLATGHDHDGSNSKKISFLSLLDRPLDNNTVVMSSSGTLTTGDDKNPIPLIITETGTITHVWAAVVTAPTGADIIIDVEVSSNGGMTWTPIWSAGNRLTISAGNTSADTGTIDTPAVTAGDRIRLNIDQVGSTIAGSTLVVEVVFGVSL